MWGHTRDASQSVLVFAVSKRSHMDMPLVMHMNNEHLVRPVRPKTLQPRLLRPAQNVLGSLAGRRLSARRKRRRACLPGRRALPRSAPTSTPTSPRAPMPPPFAPAPAHRKAPRQEERTGGEGQRGVVGLERRSQWTAVRPSPPTRAPLTAPARLQCMPCRSCRRRSLSRTSICGGSAAFYAAGCSHGPLAWMLA